MTIDDTETAPAESGDVIELLDEYMTAREAGAPVNIAEFEQRAGDQAAELRRNIDIAEKLTGLSHLIVEEPLEATETYEFSRFRTTALLGTGGYSKVYLAFDPDLSREVALKVLPLDGFGANDETLAEARALARLDHPSVVKVFEVGEHERQAYIAMEHVDGPDLRSVLWSLEGDGAVEDPRAQDIAGGLGSTAERCGLVARLARALAHCHATGIVHRDVKPENILLPSVAAPKLLDFGLARQESVDLTNTTQSLRGTPAYLAPEQVDRGTGGADFASDQFSLGVLLYELLTLSHPFRKATIAATMAAVSASQPVSIRKVNPAVPLDVELICSRAMERQPERRYGSLTAFADDLEAFLDHRAVSVRPPSPWRQLWLAAVRHRRYVTVAAVTSLLILGAGALSWAAHGGTGP